MSHLTRLRTLAVTAGFATLVSLQAYALTMTDHQENLNSIQQLAESGKLTMATEMIDGIVSDQNLTEDQQRDLEFEKVRIERIRRDYRVTEEKLKGWLADPEDGVADYDPALFDQLEADGYFDYKFIDDEKLYIGASRANLFFRHDELRKVGFKPEPSRWEKFVRDEVKRISEVYNHTAEPPHDERHFLLTYTIRVKEGAVEKGELLECWMPFPQEFEWQGDIELISTTPPVHTIAPGDYPMRSLYFQKTASGDGVDTFEATWRMSRTPQHTDVDPSIVTRGWTDPSVEIFTEEQEHVKFTPDLVALEKEIAGDLTNPAEKARAYYDWMQKNIKYSYAREYSTLTNISQYVCENRYGDCGQIALMYITLCRIGGIPARWSSGWNIYPTYVGIHDWSEIYLEPYGWIHVDANWGIVIEREFHGMSSEDKQMMSDYYFGGIDAYRFTANRNHGIMFTPAKTDFRSDTVDFQRGELEANDRNIYYGDYTFALDVRLLDGHPQQAYNDKAISKAERAAARDRD